MEAFPEEIDLITLFEIEPVIINDNIPWFYNTLFFKLLREGVSLHFTVQPALGTVAIAISINNEIIIDLELEDIKRLEIDKKLNQESLILFFEERKELLPIRIQTKPYIRIKQVERNFRK